MTSQYQKNTPVEAVFADANVLLEIILGRPKQAAARRFLQKQTGDIFISALTAHLVVHFGRPIVSMRILREFLSDYTVLSLEAVDFEWAFTNAQNQDFEDALQLAVAIRNGCSQIVTFDKSLAATYGDLIQIKTKLLH